MRLHQTLQKHTCPGEARHSAQVMWAQGAVGSRILGWLQWESQGIVVIPMGPKRDGTTMGDTLETPEEEHPGTAGGFLEESTLQEQVNIGEVTLGGT